jgi:NAD(P)-dependent dehydrogenase (short-subunit alcohol dehydrogenase family)
VPVAVASTAAAPALARTEFGHLDYAVNNAGMPGRGRFLEIEIERFDQVLNVNLRGSSWPCAPNCRRCWPVDPARS